MSEELANAFEDTLKEESLSVISDLAEVGIDSVMDDGALKDIPFLSTAIGLYKIGKTVWERHHIKQLALFVDAIKQGCANGEKRKKYIAKLRENKKYRNQELEFILVVLDSYLEYEKPEMLAKLYLAYLNGEINWDEFSSYAAILRSLIPADIMLLGKEETVKTNQSKSAAALRLLSFGLVYENEGPLYPRDSEFDTVTDEQKLYAKTQYGKAFANIVLNGI